MSEVSQTAPQTYSLVLEQAARAAAEAAERRYRQLLESAPDAIVIVDRQGLIRLVNSQTEAIFGYERDELLGKSVELLVPERFRGTHPGVREHYQEKPRTRPMGSGLELYARHRDGHEIPVEISLSATDEGGDQLVTAIIRDVSERRALERMQREFIAVMSHELMNPVTAIGLHAELLQMTEEYNADALNGIMVSARRLERLIGDLLDVSRLETRRLRLQVARLDLRSLVQQTVEQTQLGTRRHQLRFEAPSQPLIGWWDPVRLGQIFHNLLSNAVKYSAGGEIVVRLDDLDDAARVSVADQGQGIDPRELPRLFERFYRAEASERRVQGLGLGLYITKSLVEAHHGEIQVESTPGRGTTFRVTLPYTTLAPAEPA